MYGSAIVSCGTRPIAAQTWRKDLGIRPQIANVRGVLAQFQISCGGNDIGGFGGDIAFNAAGCGAGARNRSGQPGAGVHGDDWRSAGTMYYADLVDDGTLVNTRCERLAGEASLWVGDFSSFELNNGKRELGAAAGSPGLYGSDVTERQLLCRRETDEQRVPAVLVRQQPRSCVGRKAVGQLVVASPRRHGCFGCAPVRRTQERRVHAP